MKRKFTALSHSCLFSVLAVSNSHAITIDFDYSYDKNNFFTAERRIVLENAATYFSTFKDQLMAVSADGNNNWTASFFDPSNPSQLINVKNLKIPENTIKVYVGAANLSSGVLGTAAVGGYYASGTDSFLNKLTRRGQGETLGSNANDVSLWGGSLYLNSTVNWNNSLQSTPEFSQYDLYSVVLHELGHLFGLGASDSWFNKVFNNYFIGENSVAAYGGPVKLNAEGDHWASGTLSTVNGVVQEASLAPSIYNGQRKFFTGLDKAAFKDIGWETEAVSEVPLPGALGLYMLGVFGCAYRKYKK